MSHDRIPCRVAYVELPDGKVLSGSECGNMLLWDGGFIKVELAKKGKKSCHNVSHTPVQTMLHTMLHTG